MLFNTVTLAVLGAAIAVECGTVGHLQLHQNLNRRTGNQVFRRQANSSASCLDASVLSPASAKTGQEPGTDGIKAGQAPSATDPNNFIDFCKGQTITNGLQNIAGSCNPIPMGKIPAKTNMISTIITNPLPGQKVSAFVSFDVTVQIAHLEAGKFTNPTVTYYTAPVDLNGAGDIIGHCHITIQDLGGSLAPKVAPDATLFAFFKGIDDAGDGKGGLKATVTGGLPAGFYRICTMNSAANHQPVNMPVAQRGAQDDCTKVEVVDDGKGTPPVSSVAASAATGVNEQASSTAGAVGTGAAGNGGGKASTTAKATATSKAGSGRPGKGRPGKGSGSKGSGSKGSGSKGSGSEGSGSKNSGGKGSAPVKATTVAAGSPPATTEAAGGVVSTKGAAVISTSSVGTAVAAPSGGSTASAAGPGPSLLPITKSGNADRPFACNGNTFVYHWAAVHRACDIQFNQCADAVNTGKLAGPMAICTAQKKACK